MLPLIPKPPISRSQKAAAIAIAGVADLLQICLFPAFMEGGLSPFDDALDFIVALLLMIVCGFRWQFILAFALELVPGLDLLPTWTAVVLTIPSATEADPIETVAEDSPPPPIQPPPRITTTTLPRIPPQISPPTE